MTASSISATLFILFFKIPNLPQFSLTWTSHLIQTAWVGFGKSSFAVTIVNECFQHYSNIFHILSFKANLAQNSFQCTSNPYSLLGFALVNLYFSFVIKMTYNTTATFFIFFHISDMPAGLPLCLLDPSTNIWTTRSIAVSSCLCCMCQYHPNHIFISVTPMPPLKYAFLTLCSLDLLNINNVPFNATFFFTWIRLIVQHFEMSSRIKISGILLFHNLGFPWKIA